MQPSSTAEAEALGASANCYVALCHCGLYSDSRMPHACQHAEAGRVQACYSVAQWRRINNRVMAPRLPEAERQHAAALAHYSASSWQAPTYDSLPEANARLRAVLLAHAPEAAPTAWSTFASMVYGAVAALRRWRWHAEAGA